MNEKIKDLKEKAKLKAKESLAFAGYILYIWNPEKLHSKLYPLPEIKSTVRISSVGESFNLGKPALFIEGKPLFIVIRELPFSIELDLLKKDESLIISNKSKKKQKKYPNSIGLEILSKNERLEAIDKTIPPKSNIVNVLREKGYSASEIDAKINSMYVNTIFRAKRLTRMDIAIFLLSLLSSVLITSMIFMLGG